MGRVRSRPLRLGFLGPSLFGYENQGLWLLDFSWISSDSSEIETYQWVIREKRAKVFMVLSPSRSKRRDGRAWVLGTWRADLFMGQA